MHKYLSVLALSSVLLLTSCGGNGSSPDPKPPVVDSGDVFTEKNSMKGEIPATAEKVSPEEFKRALASGETVLVSDASLEAQKAATEKQYQDDKAFLQALPSKSSRIVALLEQVAKTPNYQGDVSTKLPNGQTVALIGLGQQLRQAVENYTLSQSVDNALAVYTLTYNSLSSDLKAKVASPATLQGKAMVDVQTAQSNLEKLLSSRPNLGGGRPETATSSVPFKNVGLFSSQTVKPGHGSDNAGTCTPPTGFVAQYWFPLKNFVSPSPNKNQGWRGTCWAFAAVGVLESRERVQNGTSPDLSEQFFVNKYKLEWEPSKYVDGGSPEKALQYALNSGQVLPGENGWTYNQATGRPGNAFDDSIAGTKASYPGACDGYDGNCSQTAHQSEESCTTVIFEFCSYRKVTYSGSGVASGKVRIIYPTPPFGGSLYELPNVETMASLLESGHVLIGTFPVFSSFRDANDNKGLISDDLTNAKKDQKGSHVVQIVAFLSNSVLSTPSKPISVKGGGYFVIKNSWACAGDGGYYYLPANYLQQIFTNISVLDFDERRSDAWKKDQATPASSEAPQITLKNTERIADLRVETDLENFFAVSHSIAKNVNLKITSDIEGTLFDGDWKLTNNSLGARLPRTFNPLGVRKMNITAKYGTTVASQDFLLYVVNTPPKLELKSTGTPRQFEPFSVTAQIKDINEPDLNKLCAKTIWSVTAPDTLSSTTGCSTQVTFGATGSRVVKASTKDSENESGASQVSFNVLQPATNPFPKIKTSGVYSLERDQTTCNQFPVAAGVTIDLGIGGCDGDETDETTNPAPRFTGRVEVENPSNEALTYDWRLIMPGCCDPSGEYSYSDSLGSSSKVFDLLFRGNGNQTTKICRVTLTVNAPEASRSKTLTVWSGSCTYKVPGPN